MHIEQWTCWQWIQFYVGNQVIPYSLETLFPHQKMWARMNLLTDINAKRSARILVPEHIVSLLVMLSVQSWWWFRPDVSVYLPKSLRWKEVFAPVLWPGIACDKLELLHALLQESSGSRENIWVFDPTHLIGDDEQSVKYNNLTTKANRSISRKWILQQATWCCATVVSNAQIDISWTLSSESEAARVDFSAICSEHFAARAMWRLPISLLYYWVKWLHTLWLFNGITSDNYFLAWPKSNTETIRASMHERYRIWFNEHSYHSLYADLPGELAALAASLWVDRFHAQFVFENMRHEDRLNRFGRLKNEKILTPTKAQEIKQEH
jgi:hypothetical protein